MSKISEGCSKDEALHAVKNYCLKRKLEMGEGMVEPEKYAKEHENIVKLYELNKLLDEICKNNK